MLTVIDLLELQWLSMAVSVESGLLLARILWTPQPRHREPLRVILGGRP